MIAVTFALKAESAGLAAALNKAAIQNRSAMIWHTGVGRETCERQIDALFERSKPTLLISSGFAGGVRDDLQVGDLILAKNFSDADLLDQARYLLQDRRVSVANLLTSQSIVASATERDEIARGHDVAAVDMETEFIARKCAAVGVRMVSLRAISDTVREPLPAPPNVLFDLERQKTNLARLGWYLTKRPSAVLALIRFAQQIGKTRVSLTSALVKLVTNL